MSQPTSDNEEILDAEKLVQERLGDYPLDFASLEAISNIYRAAAAVSRRAERTVLAEYRLSWGGFTILWVLWVWGEMETAQLAKECGIAKGTLTGMLTTLENRQLVQRSRATDDKRRMLVELTEDGTEMIAELFPRFNTYEAQMSNGLTAKEKHDLASSLRTVITNATDE